MYYELEYTIFSGIQHMRLEFGNEPPGQAPFSRRVIYYLFIKILFMYLTEHMST